MRKSTRNFSSGVSVTKIFAHRWLHMRWYVGCSGGTQIDVAYGSMMQPKHGGNVIKQATGALHNEPDNDGVLTGASVHTCSDTHRFEVLALENHSLRQPREHKPRQTHTLVVRDAGHSI
jgi:hypothetical protein